MVHNGYQGLELLICLEISIIHTSKRALLTNRRMDWSNISIFNCRFFRRDTKDCFFNYASHSSYKNFFAGKQALGTRVCEEQVLSLAAYFVPPL